jgi:hypothetical protein
MAGPALLRATFTDAARLPELTTVYATGCPRSPVGRFKADEPHARIAPDAVSWTGIACGISPGAFVVTVSVSPNALAAVDVELLTAIAFDVTTICPVAPGASIPIGGATVKLVPAVSAAVQVIELALEFLMVTVRVPPLEPHETVLKSTGSGVTLTIGASTPVPLSMTMGLGMG